MLSLFIADPPREIAHVPIGRIIFGRWKGEDVILVRTLDRCWEIHCHGGAAAIRRIMNDLTDRGAAAESSRTCPIAESRDDIHAAVFLSLPHCRTWKTAGLVLAQRNNSLRNILDLARQPVTTAEHQSAAAHLDRWRSVAEHLTEPWRIAVVGPPNAGKSSLINALAGMQRSIVSTIPGTTRDLVEVDIVFAGWTFRLIDTAGVRAEAESPLESVGMQLALDVLKHCDVICVVTDSTSDCGAAILTEQISDCHVPVVWLRNKCDLLPQTRAIDDGMESAIEDNSVTLSSTIHCSAVTGEGLSEFLQFVKQLLIPVEPDAETALPLPTLQALASRVTGNEII